MPGEKEEGWELHPNDSEGAPESGAQDANKEGSDSSAAPEQDSGQESGQAQPPAEALKPEEEGKPEEGAEQEGDKLPPFHEHPRWKEVQQQLADLQEQLQQKDANVQNLNDQILFYQQQVNAAAPQGQPMPSQQTGQQQPGAGQQAQPQQLTIPPAGQLPQGVIGPPQVDPRTGQEFGGWEKQSDMVPWFEHRAAEIAHVMRTEAEQQIQQSFQTLGATINAIQEHVIKSSYPDYDDTVKDTLNDVFVLDPAGNIVGVKNPALVQYFYAQPFPQLAMYRYAMNKQAPKKIKEGTSKATKDALSKVGTKPKGPTQPKAVGSQGEIPDLDWDTPRDQAEEYLDKRGLI